MKIFTNKKLRKILIMIFIVMLLFEITIPNTSKAVDWGGTLLLPVQALLLGIGDAGIDILNSLLLSEGDILNSMPVITLSRKTSFLENIPIIGKNMFKPARAVMKFVSRLTGSDKDFVDAMELPVYAVSPEEIFSNQIPLLDVNIISPKNDETSTAHILQKTISSWYVVLRDIAIVAFLSVLVYIGIRIVISSTAQDKSKYKQLLGDWVVGLCLLFFMHYIMSFSLMFTEKLTGIFNNQLGSVAIKEDMIKFSYFDTSGDAQTYIDAYNDGNESLNWKTDVTGLVRFYAQTNINSLRPSTQFGYTIMYFILVIYTFMFLFQYLKRLFNIVLLTMISPMVALAYPLDKITDGKAQAFNMWLKEYIFNLLIQPMHLILYTVLVGSALSLVVDHPIYAIAVLGALSQAEKFVRKLFGFEKASTMGSVTGGMFTGAAVMQGMNYVTGKVKQRDNSAGSGKGSGSDKNSRQSNDRINMANSRTSSYSNEEEELYMQEALNAGSNRDSSYNNTDDGTNNGTNNTSSPQSNGANNTQRTVPDNAQARQHYQTNNQNSGGQTVGNSGSGVINNGNYLRQIHPEQYDNYGNYNQRNGTGTEQNIPRRSMRQTANGIKRKIKNSPLYRAGSKVMNSKPMRYTRAATKIYAPKAIKTAAKAAAIAVGATTLGAIGVSAGLASDNNANTFKYGVAGLAGGIAVGNATVNSVSRMPNAVKTVAYNAEQAKAQIQKEVYKNDPKELKRIENEKSDNAFRDSKEIKQLYADKFGKENYKEAMENAMEYRKHGIKDDNLIIKAMTDKTGEIGKTSATDKRRIAAAQLASGVKDAKGIKSMTERLEKQGVEKNVINDNEEFVRSINNLRYM